MSWLRAIALCGLAGLTFQIDAQVVPTEIPLQWDPSVTYTDGVPFDESEIQHYDLYCDGAHLRQIANDFTRITWVSVDDLGSGDHTCALSETVHGLESVVSNVVSFTLGQRRPNPPTLSVSIL